MGYIPTITILEEGGYEGDGAQRVYGLPAKWDKSIESGILAGFSKILKMTFILKKFLTQISAL